MYINIRHNKYLAVFLCPCVMLHVAHYRTCLGRMGTHVFNSFRSPGVKDCASKMVSQ